jgi:hypothetical protein
MFYRLRTTWNKRRFDRLTRRILDTPPIHTVNADWSIISMVSNSDVQMYILSIKSFYARIGRGKVIVIVDRDMPQQPRGLLKEHIRGIQFVHLEDIDTGHCQRGGTWERLVYLLKHAQSEYAIQLDSDTLAFGADLAEILDCANNNRAFTLNQNHQKIQTMREYATNAQSLDVKYVGIHVEKMFDRYPNCDRLRYVRGSSGLAGFSLGGFAPNKLEEFHEAMRRLLGDNTWRKWGTEQCASNFAIANSPDALVLPYPKYANFDPISVWSNEPNEQNEFLHFIGTYRYHDDFFVHKARVVIKELASA